MDKSTFATIVTSALPYVGAWGRFGDEKVFIFALWQEVKDSGPFDDWDLSQFKAALVAAQRDGAIRLARADLVYAMDPLLVARSETHSISATYHFVLDEARR